MPFRSFDDSRRQIQVILQEAGLYHGKIDGDFGIKSQRAYDLLDVATDHELQPGDHRGKASSFADPGDVARFKRCKAQGGTDLHCFGEGDNGIGKWGDDTTADTPMCALPRDIWANVANPRGKKVIVKYKLLGDVEERVVICELRDTLPATKNIRNGAAIDLNESAGRALEVIPPFLISVTWAWA